MTYTLEELTTPMTADEIEEAIYSAIEARGAKTTSWKTGAVVRTIIAGASITLAAFSTLQSLIAKSGFLDFAEEDWLTFLAQYLFGVTRSTGTFASGEVTLTNTSATPYSGGADDLIVANSTTDKVYRSTGAWTVAAYSTADVAIQAVEVGSDSTSPASDIDTLVTTLSGVTVSNAAAVVGTDEEEDSALRNRCLERTGPLSPNGPKDAYAYVARNATDSDGNEIGVTRVATQAVGDGSVKVWVASATGAITGTVGNPATDLGAIAEEIYEKAEPLGIEAVVDTASIVNFNITYQAWIYTSVGLTESEIEDLIEAALINLCSNTPIGGHVIGASRTLYLDDIISTIDAVKEEIFHVVLTLPAVDIVLGIDEIPVINVITPTITLVTGGDL